MNHREPIRRHLLKAEAAHALKAEITQGRWTGKLPSERYLTDYFQISRGTLREALKTLADEGVIQSVAKQGHFIRKGPTSPSSARRSDSVGLLLGDLDPSRPADRLAWLPKLQELLGRQGLSVHVHEAIPELDRSPKKAISKLLQVTRHRCWLLVRCPRVAQLHFQEYDLPALICGSPFPGIHLPHIDIDYKATARHAVGTLAAQGHRHIGLVISTRILPGDLATLDGFKQGIADSSFQLNSTVIRYPNLNYSFESILGKIAQEQSPWTALFVDDPLQTLNIATRAMALGIALPQRLYLLCRENAVFLDHLFPPPGRYHVDVTLVAKKILQAILARAQGNPMKGLSTLILPDYLPGAKASP